jgi:hypothetical protein
MGNRFAALIVFAAAACQPMYGGPAEHLHPVKTLPKGPQPAEPPIAYVDDCTFDFHSRPATKHRAGSPQLDETAAQQLARAEADTPARGELIQGSIATYSRALAADPYDADATLGLALAYDHVLHKGCALALLKRLGKLADHPTFAAAAGPVADSVGDHAAWFKGYRREALAALGRP